MSIRDEALAADAGREERERRDEDSHAGEERRREKERREVKEAEAMRLLTASPLSEWFPGAEWEWYGEQLPFFPAAFCADRPAGTNPTYAGVPVFLLEQRDPDKPVKVKCVTERTDSGSGGYTYWDGPGMRSAADVGRYIRNSLDPEAARLRGRGAEEPKVA